MLAYMFIKKSLNTCVRQLPSSCLLISIYLENDSKSFQLYYFLHYSEQQINWENTAVSKVKMDKQHLNFVGTF